MTSCISCGKKIDPAKTETEAYIVPAALGGRLTAKKQYCKACHKLFESNVDKPFVKLFSPVMSLLTSTKYQDIKQTKTQNDQQPRFDPLLYSSDKNKQLLAKGLNKIAVSYALSKGVDSGFINHLLDENNFFVNDNIIPYLPLGATERAFEMLRIEIEESFPTHSLKLFTTKHGNTEKEYPILACFIDLFSTFQFFVILNDAYSGPIIKDTLSFQPVQQAEGTNIPIRIQSQEEMEEWQRSGIDSNALYEKYQQLSTLESSKVDFFSFAEEQIRNLENEQLFVKCLERLYSRVKANEVYLNTDDSSWDWLQQKIHSWPTLEMYTGIELIDVPRIQFEIAHLLHESKIADIYFYEHEEIQVNTEKRISTELSFRVNFVDKANEIRHYLDVLNDLYAKDMEIIDIYWQCKYLALQDFCQARSLVTKMRGLRRGSQ